MQGEPPRKAIERCQAAAETAAGLLGKEHIVWLRVRQLQLDCLHRLAVHGDASTAELVQLVQVRPVFFSYQEQTSTTPTNPRHNRMFLKLYMGSAHNIFQDKFAKH